MHIIGGGNQTPNEQPRVGPEIPGMMAVTVDANLVEMATRGTLIQYSLILSLDLSFCIRFESLDILHVLFECFVL